MKLLIIVSNPASTAALKGLIGACTRRKQSFICFFTGDGVQTLSDPDVYDGITHAERAVVCEKSWSDHFPGQPAPFEEGSQTDHSAMLGEADQVLSL